MRCKRKKIRLRRSNGKRIYENVRELRQAVMPFCEAIIRDGGCCGEILDGQHNGNGSPMLCYYHEKMLEGHILPLFETEIEGRKYFPNCYIMGINTTREGCAE